MCSTVYRPITQIIKVLKQQFFFVFFSFCSHLQSTSRHRPFLGAFILSSFCNLVPIASLVGRHKNLCLHKRHKNIRLMRTLSFLFFWSLLFCMFCSSCVISLGSMLHSTLIQRTMRVITSVSFVFYLIDSCLSRSLNAT